MKLIIHISLLTLLSSAFFAQQNFEKDGFVMVEAENYSTQRADEIRKWYTIDADFSTTLEGMKENLASSASGGRYLMILPDTRVTRDNKLIQGVNFTNTPGEMAILDYRIHFQTTGRYFVWVSAFSSGSEDNGIHTGINGEWPESGARMQWCQGKNQWTWASKQRSLEKHCGVEQLIYLDIKTTGWHTVSFSMREDGFCFDRFALSKKYEIPQGSSLTPAK
jgi:hypothetical protein